MGSIEPSNSAFSRSANLIPMLFAEVIAPLTESLTESHSESLTELPGCSSLLHYY